MKPLNELEAYRDAALAELKEASLELRGLLEEEERFLKENRRLRLELEKKKQRIGRRSEAAQACIARLEAKVPREIETAISERTAKFNADQFQFREHKRDLDSRKFDLKTLIAQKAQPDQLREIRDNIAQLEVTVGELGDDLEEQRKGLDATTALRREALESMEDEAKKELEALRALSA